MLSKQISSLDGLRGIASLIVVHEHLFGNFSRTFANGYGINGTKFIVQWPFIRIFWCALSMVNIFFVISGYVLSYKPLWYAQRGNPSAARASVASSTFRRLPRLYLPMWTSVLICGFMVWAGLFNRSIMLWELRDANGKQNPYFLDEESPRRFDSTWLLIKDVLAKLWHTLDVFGMTDHLIHAEYYGTQTWTVPVELRSSMVLFAVVTATSHFKTHYRMLVVFLVGTTVMTHKQKNTMMFLTGALMADCDHIIREVLQRLETDPRSDKISRREQFIAKWLHPNSYIFPAVFVVGIFLCCVPRYFYLDDPFYYLLVKNVPLQQYNEPDVWLRYYGATIVVWAVANSTRLKPIFASTVCTYLGKISFALYLLHVSIIRSLLYSAIPTMYQITGDGTRENQTVTAIAFWAIVGWLMVVPLSICLADQFTKRVDTPCIRLTRRMEVAMSESHPDQPIGPIR